MRVWSKVEELLSKEQISYEVQFTQGSGHATEIAQGALVHQYKAVVTIGGDGTIHEVGNGLIGTDTPLGIISGGTGNDMVAALGIPVDPKGALERILRHEVKQIDTADIGGKTMIGSLGIGFDATVAEKVNCSSWKKWMGRFSYFYGIIHVLSLYTPSKVTLEVDGKEHEMEKIWFIAITNIPNYGGGMQICPEARFDDGLLDVCCVGSLSKSQLVRMASTIYKGKHIDNPGVRMYQGSQITVHSQNSLLVHADGEVISKTPLTICVLPGSLRVL